MDIFIVICAWLATAGLWMALYDKDKDNEFVEFVVLILLFPLLLVFSFLKLSFFKDKK